jgi:hypothetical protein
MRRAATSAPFFVYRVDAPGACGFCAFAAEAAPTKAKAWVT